MTRLKPGTRLAAAAALVAVALTVAGVVLAVNAYQDARDRAVRDVAARARAAAADTTVFVSTQLTTLARLADNPAVASADSERIAQYLTGIPATRIGFPGGLAWFDARGVPRAAPWARGAEGIAAAVPAPIVRDVQASGRPAVGDAVVLPVFAGPSIVFAVPTRDRAGRRAGVLAGAVSVRWLAQSATRYPLPRGGSLSIVDGTGRLVAGPPVGRVPVVPRPGSVADRLRAGAATGTATGTVGLGGTDRRIVSWAREPRSGWILVAERPLGDAVAGARNRLLGELAALVLVAAAGIAVMVLLGRRLDRLALAQEEARQSAERRRRSAEALQELTARLSRAESPPEVQRVLLDVALRAFGGDVAAVRLADGGTSRVARRPRSAGGRLEPREVTIESWPRPEAPLPRHPLWAHGPEARTVATGLAELLPTCGTTMVLPLVVGSQVVGVLGVAAVGAREVGEEERQLQLAVAGQAAVALERARLREQEHEIAVELQRALLPPAVGGRGASAAVYRPADAHLAVGGDWYDVIDLPDGRVVLVVGDVVGHGVRAAAVMGRLRTAIAALAMVAEGPAELLMRLDAFAPSIDGAEFSTVACAYVDPRTGTLRSASAGHPPILLVAPGQEAEYVLAGRSLPLCAAAGARRGEDVRVLSPGSTVVLFSDGLYERRTRPFRRTFEDVLSIATELGVERVPPDRLASELVERMLDGSEQTDDIAVLALRLEDDLAPALVLGAGRSPEELAALRHLLRAWLAAEGVHREDAADLGLAVHEACANAIEHAYPAGAEGGVTVQVALDDGAALVGVRDEGRWIDDDSEENRGRGLLLIRALVDQVDLVRGATGTTVRMRRRLRHVAVAGEAGPAGDDEAGRSSPRRPTVTA